MMKTMLCTSLALLAFASNSVLCRLALGEQAIDAASFTSVRLLSGILVLMLILGLKQSPDSVSSKGSWRSALFLFIYAIAFSFAYISLETGVGALILFGSVQLTLILLGLASGSRLRALEWCGLLLAFSGFVYLLLPGLSAPPLLGFCLMSLAGAAWGFYTFAGKGSKNPLMDTGYNFLRTLPLVLILMALSFSQFSWTQEGILLAIISGGITSGLGYTIWYIALGGLSAIQAAVVQLLVPVIAALGGVIFAGEELSGRLVIAALMILGGTLVVILAKHALTSIWRRG
ncbi:DMT family transporter [Shewanella sp. AS1]|uniref:DMT family transporter n=1 Tax=Shewanella sp. AS1 TaxID=2907626 RepID=UPI002DD44992|nr:DMT family transporter [Shewanella sp. AS1]